MPSTREHTVPSNKSQQARAKSLARKVAQSTRGSAKFKGGSNVHNGASRGQSGQPKR
jgi:hypothetical protein